METEILTNDLNKAAGIIKNGGLVAVPTETVYGLAGNGLDKNAVDKIYEVKGRPRIKPLSLMVPGEESIKNYCNDIPEAAYTLAGEFWPGPLTIVLNAKTDLITDIVLKNAGAFKAGLRSVCRTLSKPFGQQKPGYRRGCPELFQRKDRCCNRRRRVQGGLRIHYYRSLENTLQDTETGRSGRR